MFTDIHLNELGRFIRQRRIAIGLSQNDIRNLTGLNENTLRRIENGRVIPKFETLEILSTLLKTDLLQYLRQSRSNPIISSLYEKIDNVFILESNETINELKLLEESLIKNEAKYNLINPHELIQLKTVIHSCITYHNDSNSEHINEAVKNLSQSLQLSIINFSLECYHTKKYTPFEIRILLLIALLLVKINQIEVSTDILLYCIEYLDGIYENTVDILKLKIKLYYNVSYNYHTLDNHQMALEYASKGINFSLKNNNIFRLPFLLARKGIAEYYLKLPNAFETFSDTLYMLRLTQDLDNYNLFLKIFKSKYNYKHDNHVYQNKK